MVLNPFLTTRYKNSSQYICTELRGSIRTIIGSKGATREAFKNGLLADGQTYPVQDILTRFYPELLVVAVA